MPQIAPLQHRSTVLPFLFVRFPESVAHCAAGDRSAERVPASREEISISVAVDHAERREIGGAITVSAPQRRGIGEDDRW